MKKLGFWVAVGLLCVTTGVAVSESAFDFGLLRDLLLRDDAWEFFGVDYPLLDSSNESVDATTAEADPTSLATFVRSLQVRVVTAAANTGP